MVNLELFKNRYEEDSCYVKIDGKSSETGERGETGLCFITIPIPASDRPSVEAAVVITFGLSINNYYMRGFLHTDGIRILATSAESLQEQVGLVKTFMAKKTSSKFTFEVVIFARNHQEGAPVGVVEKTFLPVSGTGKCLGVWWKGNLMAKKNIEENIKKARREFFLLGYLVTFQVI